MEKSDEIEFLVVGPHEGPPYFVEKILHENGDKNVLRVFSANEARKVLKKKIVGCVITEFDMPSMNGVELTKLIRRDPALYETPVLVLFEQSKEQQISYAMEEHADACLMAPFSAEEFLEAVRKIAVGQKDVPSEQQKLKAARMLLLYKKYDKAIAVAKEVLAQGENDDAFHIISEAYYWQRDYEQATRYLRWLMKSRPDSQTMHLLSKVCRAENQCGDAIGYLMKATIQNPLNLDLKIDLGKLYLDLNIVESADHIFQEVLQAEPSDLHLIKIGKAYLRKGEIKKAGEYLSQTVRPIPETVYVLHDYAMVLAKQKRYQESAEQFEKCLLIVPNNITFLVGLGKMLVQMHQTQRALEVYKQILGINPHHKEAGKVVTFLLQKEVAWAENDRDAS